MNADTAASPPSSVNQTKAPEATAADTTLSDHPQSEQHQYLRGNYFAMLAHGLLGQTGFRLIMAPTFVPAYIYVLSGSELIVGLALAAQHLGSALSSMPGGTLLESRRRVLPVLFLFGGLMRSQILLIALAGLLLSDAPSLVVTCIALFLFGLFSGMQGVTFQTILGKIIPVEVRGGLTGFRNSTAGLVSAGVAFTGGSYFIEANTWGNGYAVTFLVAFTLTMLGMATLIFVREPTDVPVRKTAGFRERMREMPALLRGDRAYTAFVLARSVAAVGMMAVPYYVIFAGERVGLTGETVGILSVAFLLSATVSDLLWGLMADRTGNRLVFVASVGMWAASTLALLVVPPTTLWMMVVFAAVGAGMGGYQIGSINLILEFGDQEDRPMRIAIANTAHSLMYAAAPLLGGVLTLVVSHPAIFILASLAQLISLAVIMMLVDEPRHRDSYRAIEVAEGDPFRDVTAALRIASLRPDVQAIDALRKTATKEGFTFLDRLVEHWESGRHGFGHPGEKLIGGYDGTTLVALGCLTQDPHTDDQRAGRIRHFYVLPNYRRHGVGREIITDLISDAGPHFDVVRLTAEKEGPAKFLETLGFVPSEADESTHEIRFDAIKSEADKPAETSAE